jgi:putative GTP pyrophosphokinase
MTEATAVSELEAFLSRNRIDREIWEKSRLDWGILQAIVRDHSENEARLLQSAEMFAKVIQSFPRVHSVRWRVKNSDHLLEKIVRKRAEGSEKYAAIDAENYFTIVTDLVGIRALHLFKADCLEIDPHLRATWKAVERPMAYVRAGDQDDFVNKFKAKDFDVSEHPAGYRSVHYVFESQPLMRKVMTEVQVRTIFEEGWSEIDHHVRYPNFSDNELVGYFLNIFNRMAGSADEMGGFVRGLAATLEGLSSQVAQANAQKAASIAELEKSASEIESLRRQGKESSASIAKLKEEIAKMKRASTLLVTLPSSVSARNVGQRDQTTSTLAFIQKALESFSQIGPPGPSIGASVDGSKKKP